MVYNTDNLYYLKTQQKVSNNLHKHQTNEYEYMLSDCNKIGYSEHVCSRLFHPKLKIKTTSENIDYNFNLNQSSKLGPCCKNELELCHLKKKNNNLCNINNKKTFKKNYKFCCNSENMKSEHKKICKNLSKHKNSK